MRKKTSCVILILLILCVIGFTGCTFGNSGKNQTEEETTEAETVISTLKCDSVSITGNLQTAVNVKIEKISSDKDLYSTIKNSVSDDNLVRIEIYYINLYDNTDEKVQQDGEAEFRLKLTEAMKKAGGNTYELYYYNSSKGEAYPVDFTYSDGFMNFKTDNIGFFAILNVNNSGVEITKPDKEQETEQATEAPFVSPTEAPTKKPTEAPTEKATEKQTEAPTEKPTEKPTEAPTEKPTEKPTEAPTEKPTEAPTEAPTKADEIPTLEASGNNEKPNIKVYNSDKANGSVRTYSVHVYNYGNYTVRILAGNSSLNNPELGEDYDRELNLVSSVERPGVIQYVDIGPGEDKDVAFAVIGDQAWYDRYTVTEFRFYYDGSIYICDTSTNGTQINKI